MLDVLLSLYLGFMGIFGSGPESPTPTASSNPPTSERQSIDYTTLASTTARVVRVLDGDTIEVIFPDGWRERVRYLGIDAPEVASEGARECFSREATARNRALVAGEEVILRRDTENRDPYDRLLRYVRVDDVSVNAHLLGSGHARLMVIPPNTARYTEYRRLRDAARADGQGLWRACAE